MPKRLDTSAKLPLTCFLFCMIAAIFAYGLHARIELFRAGTPTTSAKLSIQKRLAAQVVAEIAVDAPPVEKETLDLLRFIVEFAFFSAAFVRFLQAESSLWNPSGPRSRGPSLMLRPPPVQV